MSLSSSSSSLGTETHLIGATIDRNDVNGRESSGIVKRNVYVIYELKRGTNYVCKVFIIDKKQDDSRKK